MKRLPIYAGIVLAGILLFKVHTGEITAIDVLIMQNGHQGEANIAQTDAKPATKPAEQTVIKATDDPDKLTIMAFGDMMLGRYVRTLMDRNSMDYPFQKLDFETPFFGEADVRFGNLEGPIKGKGFESGLSTTFGFNVDIAPLLKGYGFNVLSIANNHALDQHNEGRDTTVKALEAEGLGWCGNVGNAEETSVYYSKIDNASYAFVCLNDVIYPLDRTKALELIKGVREKVDYLIVSIHW
jgi:poly-gamma-glutamate synthesis protein (capsule biosynthesis protein)